MEQSTITQIQNEVERVHQTLELDVDSFVQTISFLCPSAFGNEAYDLRNIRWQRELDI